MGLFALSCALFAHRFWQPFTRVFRRLFFIALTAVAVAAAAYVFDPRARLILPAEKEYPQLPRQFHEALRERRAEVKTDGAVSAIESLGRLYQANRLYAEAAIVYKNLGKRLSLEDHYDLALLALDQGDLIEAARQLGSVAANAPRYKPAAATLAEVWFKLGKPVEAEAIYLKTLSSDADDADANLGLARIELQKGEDEKAAVRLEKLLVKHPEQTGGIALLSQLWMRRGNLERAHTLAKLSRQRPAPIEDDPWREHLLQSCYDIQALSLEFENYANAGQLVKALPLLDRVELLDPKSWIPDLLRGWSQAQTHHLDQAIASYHRALEKNGDREKLIPLLASALKELGHDSEALKLCAAASNDLPDSMPILTAYEALLGKTKDSETEARVLKRMLEKEPFTYSTNLRLSELYWEAGRRDEAARYLKQIAELYPADITSRALLGEYYISNEESELAIRLLEQALEHVGNNEQARVQLRSLLGQAYLNYAVASSSSGKYRDAGDAAEKAYGFIPSNPQLLSLAAENFAQAKDYPRAEQALRKLIVLQPDNPTLYLSLGDLEADQGKHHGGPGALASGSVEVVGHGLDAAARNSIAT